MARSHELQIQIKKPLCEENTISQYTLQYMYMYVFMRVSVCVCVCGDHGWGHGILQAMG